jgi:hypothetical protein
MTDRLDFEARLAERLRAHAALASRPFDAATIAQQAVAVGGRRRRIGRLEWPSIRPVAGWLIVALLLAIAALAGVVGIGALVRDLSPTVASPTPFVSTRDLAWSPEAAGYDWPGPIRVEPGGATRVLSKGEVWSGQEPDAVGDLDTAAPDWIDIRTVIINTGEAASLGKSNGIGLELAGPLAALPAPADSWIAYGFVLDINGDGIADQRIGMDNARGASHREWITDLATGQTSVNPRETYGHDAFGTSIDTYYNVVESQERDNVWIHISRSPRGLRFYAWASLIQDGRLVATDYAPDVGWIETYEGPVTP